MNYSNLLLKLVIALSMLALSVSACSVGTSNVTPSVQSTEFTSPEMKNVVARVNGTEITAGELKRAQKLFMAAQPGGKIPPGLNKQFEKRSLDQLVDLELLFQAGQKLEVKDLDKQVTDKFEKNRAGFTDEKDYAKRLQNFGIDENMLRDSIRRDLVVANFVTTNIAPKIAVSEEEIKTFYDKNPTNFLKPEQLKTSHILIGVDSKAGVEEKKKAREKAEKLHKELIGGADFETLAKENSTCPSSKQGGDLGYFTKGKMVPQFEKAAFALEIGGLSGVVETQYGFHIIKLMDRKNAETTPLAASTKQIEDYLKAQKTNDAIAAYIVEARKSAKIEMLLPQ